MVCMQLPCKHKNNNSDKSNNNNNKKTQRMKIGIITEVIGDRSQRRKERLT